MFSNETAGEKNLMGSSLKYHLLFWANPGNSTPLNGSGTVTFLPSQNRPRKTKKTCCWRSYKLKSSILRWTLTCGYTSVGCSALCRHWIQLRALIWKNRRYRRMASESEREWQENSVVSVGFDDGLSTLGTHGKKKYCHPQTDCFIVSQHFSVARYARFL